MLILYGKHIQLWYGSFFFVAGGTLLFGAQHLEAAFFTQIHHQLLLEGRELIPVETFVAAAETAFAVTAVVQFADTAARTGNVKEFALINHRSNNQLIMTQD